MTSKSGKGLGRVVSGAVATVLLSAVAIVLHADVERGLLDPSVATQRHVYQALTWVSTMAAPALALLTILASLRARRGNGRRGFAAMSIASASVSCAAALIAFSYVASRN